MSSATMSNKNAPALSQQPGARRDLYRRPLMAYRITELPERFQTKIAESPDGCWLWTANTTHNGYATVWWNGSMPVAHRVIYELLVGPITEETLDHLCRVRHCVNPAHLKPMSHRANTLRGETVSGRHFRKTHCKYGHPFDDENTYYYGPEKRWRRCRACGRRSAPCRLPDRGDLNGWLIQPRD